MDRLYAESSAWTRRYRNAVIAAGCLSLLALGFQFFGPGRKLTIVPSADAAIELYGYADSQTGNSAYWRDAASNSWICNYKPDAAYGCGWLVRLRPEVFTGIDLTVYSAIELTLDYQGPAKRVRFLLKNFNPAYSIPGNDFTSKSMNMTLPVEDVDGKVSIRLDEFKVASWWLMERTLNKRWSLPEFSAITHVGIDFAEPGFHEVTVRKIDVVGKWVKTGTLLAFIVVFWLSVFLGEGFVRFYLQYRRALNDRRTIRQLQEKQEMLEAENRLLESFADTDPLTGVCNRSGLYNRVEAMARQQQSLNGVGILLIDIDHFKKFNDRYGHDTGDKALKAFASVINLHLRETDIFARLGGEEFVVVCPAQSPDDLLSIAEKLRRVVQQSTPEQESPFAMTVSMGGTLIKDDESFSMALRRADEALYRAKHNGRNRVEFAP